MASAGTTIPEPGRPRTLTLERFSVVALSGADIGLTGTPDGERLVIGTGPSANLILRDPMVSHLHCEISRIGEKLMVRDLGSLNGTWVDGVSALAAYLTVDSVLSVGRTRLRVVAGGGRLELPLSGSDRFGVMTGTSASMRRVFSALERVAASDATVLLQGETGSGKEVAAESIHREGARRDGPFVVVDCGAIPPALLESELFGHARGAFTGAFAPREGAFEAASGGTVFLDEIGELPLELQPKLLRVLENREVKRVGSNDMITVDVRVLAATHRDLAAEVNDKRFRSDLYYRLAVLEVRLPPLRERPEDLPLLVEHILASFEAVDRPEAALCRTPQFFAELRRHHWPGNVRELRNYVERCLALNEQTPLARASPLPSEATALDSAVDIKQPLRSARELWTQRFERRYLEAILAAHDGNVRAAARAAGLDRAYFYRMLWRLGLREREAK